MQREIEVSRVFTEICKAKTRIIVNEGSSRSTKTFSILQYLIGKCLAERTKVTISRAKLTWLKATVIPDFEEIMQTQFYIWNENEWNKSESTYRFPNGSEIAFIGLDEAQKLHGRKQDIAWVNEAVETEEPEVRQLLLRTTKQIILDYNPSFEQHWIYDKIITRDDCTLIHSTYKDNPFLQTDIVQEIERMKPTPENIRQGTADEVGWKIYGLGIRAAHRGLIFSKVQICKDLPDLLDTKKRFFGLDFGFANDPSSLSEIRYAHGALYMKEIFYKRGLTNIINPANLKQPSIQEQLILHKVPKNVTIWADAAEPKSIQDLRNCGWDVKPAVKGPDSIVVGIETILRYNVFVTEDSLNAIKEKNNYKWKEDKDGRVLNEPIDNWNHFWDGARYGCVMEMRRGQAYMPIMGHGMGYIHTKR